MTLPVAVIGAGPVGLVAAAHLLARGETPIVLEAGPHAGASVREWGHVRLFSPWRELTDPVAASLLERTGWRAPDPHYLPLGEELVGDWIEPLGAALATAVRYSSRVVSVTRQRQDKMKDARRAEAPFEILVDGPHGEERLRARAVIDASGTWQSPNPLAANGTPAIGERRYADRIAYGIPDVLGSARGRYAGKHVLVAGSGHSAFNVLLDLATLDAPGTRASWAIRRRPTETLWGGGAADALPARGALGARLKRIVEQGGVTLHGGFHVQRVEQSGTGLLVHDEDRAIGPVDEIVVATGFRPDLELTRELRLSLDPAIECPTALGPLIDPNVHSCGTVRPHGFSELSHPEPDFYTVGMKSYGRAPTFLLLTGYEQVRSVVAALTGAIEEAREVRLVLPETGVCSSGPADQAACCAPVQKPFLQLARLPGSCGCD